MAHRTFADIGDLPAEWVDQYSLHQKAAFKNAYNRAIEKGKATDQAVREAHIAARQAGDTHR